MDVGPIDKTLNLVKPATQGAFRQTQDAAKAYGAAENPLRTEVSTQQGSVEQADALTREQVEGAVSSIREFMQSVRRDINFSIDDGSGRVVVKVTDSSTGDVIRQIPSEEALQLAENLSEVRSLLFKAEA